MNDDPPLFPAGVRPRRSSRALVKRSWRSAARRSRRVDWLVGCLPLRGGLRFRAQGRFGLGRDAGALWRRSARIGHGHPARSTRGWRSGSREPREQSRRGARADARGRDWHTCRSHLVQAGHGEHLRRARETFGRCAASEHYQTIRGSSCISPRPAPVSRPCHRSGWEPRHAPEPGHARHPVCGGRAGRPRRHGPDPAGRRSTHGGAPSLGRLPRPRRHRLPAALHRGRPGADPQPPAQRDRVAEDHAGGPVARDAHGLHRSVPGPSRGADRDRPLCQRRNRRRARARPLPVPFGRRRPRHGRPLCPDLHRGDRQVDPPAPRPGGGSRRTASRP